MFETPHHQTFERECAFLLPGRCLCGLGAGPPGILICCYHVVIGLGDEGLELKLDCREGQPAAGLLPRHFAERVERFAEREIRRFFDGLKPVGRLGGLRRLALGSSSRRVGLVGHDMAAFERLRAGRSAKA